MVGRCNPMLAPVNMDFYVKALVSRAFIYYDCFGTASPATVLPHHKGATAQIYTNTPP